MLEGLAIVGPGSEWFWSMAQFVVVAVTLIGIYYQFRLQRSANAFDQLSRIQDQWSSEPFTRTRLSAARAIKAGTSMPMASMVTIGNFWEGVATLVRLGHVDSRVVYDGLGNSARYWWSLMEDQTLRYREESESGDLMVHFEWLAAKFALFAEKDGTRADFAKTTLVAEIDEQIDAWEDRILLLEASRMVPARI